MRIERKRWYRRHRLLTERQWRAYRSVDDDVAVHAFVDERGQPIEIGVVNARTTFGLAERLERFQWLRIVRTSTMNHYAVARELRHAADRCRDAADCNLESALARAPGGNERRERDLIEIEHGDLRIPLRIRRRCDALRRAEFIVTGWHRRIVTPLVLGRRAPRIAARINHIPEMPIGIVDFHASGGSVEDQVYQSRPLITSAVRCLITRPLDVTISDKPTMQPRIRAQRPRD